MKGKKHKQVLALLLAAVLLAAGSLYYYTRGYETVAVTAQVAPSGQFLLLIDAGHGGADGGAVSPGGVHESEINLAIAHRLEALAALYGIPTELTRHSQEINYPPEAATIRAKKVADTRARVEQINQATNAVVVSIHQNIFSQDSRVRGPQVLFAPTPGSEAFATQMQGALTQGLNLERPRDPIRVPSGVYIMNRITPPAILVECGFLSNPEEEAKLKTPEYQLQLAAILLAGYVQWVQASNTESLEGGGL